MANKPSLAETHPEVAKQWHPTLNGDLTPSDVTKGSHKKVWWKCDKGIDHEWEGIVKSRSNGGGCIICRGYKIVKSNCLVTLRPEIAKEWHPTLNGELTPYDFGIGSHHGTWWKCDKGIDHEWETTINKRTSMTSNCPICRGLKIVNSNCLNTLRPDLAKEWHPTLNGELTPYDVTVGSDKQVWWKCEKGDDHEWKVNIKSRNNGNGCAICSNKVIVESNCLNTLRPDLAKEWHPTLNGDLTPYDVGTGSGKNIWWKCEKGDDHEWKAKPNSRVSMKTNCPVCSGQKVVNSNCLAILRPDIAKEWHPTLNSEISPNNFAIKSGKKVWWKCEKGDDHEWHAAISNRSLGHSCPVCSGQKVVNSNCLIVLDPVLAKEWHPTLNSDLTPYDVGTGSGKKVWWKCDKGEDHIWKSKIYDRSNIRPESKRVGCPVCANLKIVNSNCLNTLRPDLAKEWHPTLNGELTPYDVGTGSGKKVWWKCDKAENHVWQTVIGSRFLGRGCPFCTLTPQSKQELTITFELMKFFRNINPKGHKTRLDGKLRAIDIFIPKLNLAIEFDGAYWHKNKRALDKIKSEMLLEEGFKVIRIRQEPLEKIFDADIISRHPYDGKQVTNDLLSDILSMYDLGDKTVSKIKEYQAKDELQNEKGLDRYIDKILTEKASKSSI